MEDSEKLVGNIHVSSNKNQSTLSKFYFLQCLGIIYKTMFTLDLS